MTLTAQVVPLAEKDGVVRVSGTRVALDTVVAVFNTGATPEEIVQKYPTLKLADVYAVISYYLNNRGEVDAYVCDREGVAAALREENEARFDSRGIRDRLLARRAASE